MYGDLFGSLNIPVHAWKAQAALLHFLMTLGLTEHGIDENHFLALTLLCRKINDEETQREIDLIRSESDAFRLIHQVKHPPHDPNEFPINPLNGLRLMAKRRMRMVNNL